MKRVISLVLIIATCLLGGCSSTRHNEASEMRRGMRQQMSVLRTQMHTSGASSAQLRDFDKAMVELDRLMRQFERQMQAMETQKGER